MIPSGLPKKWLPISKATQYIFLRIPTAVRNSRTIWSHLLAVGRSSVVSSIFTSSIIPLVPTNDIEELDMSSKCLLTPSRWRGTHPGGRKESSRASRFPAYIERPCILATTLSSPNHGRGLSADDSSAYIPTPCSISLTSTTAEISAHTPPVGLFLLGRATTLSIRFAAPVTLLYESFSDVET